LLGDIYFSPRVPMGMRAVIPAAGAGTRLRPRTETKPKGLVRVGGKPILTWCFETVLALGVTGIVVIVGYRGEQIIEYYGGEFDGCPIDYVRQRELRGLGQAVLLSEPFITDDCIVMNGDNVFTAEVQSVIDQHEANDAVGTVVIECVDRETARQTGVLEFNDAGAFVGMVEKPADPPSQWVMTGLSVFAPVIFDALQILQPSSRGEIELADAINLLLEANRDIAVVKLEGSRWNINTLEDLDRASRALAENKMS
jgi:glucose-1-phosphate thymidylyltransferase